VIRTLGKHSKPPVKQFSGGFILLTGQSFMKFAFRVSRKFAIGKTEKVKRYFDRAASV
jgi:hypothetical protein